MLTRAPVTFLRDYAVKFHHFIFTSLQPLRVRVHVVTAKVEVAVYQVSFTTEAYKFVTK